MTTVEVLLRRIIETLDNIGKALAALHERVAALELIEMEKRK